jgi:hypothetical protein
MVHMPLTRTLAIIGFALLSACHFEDHTPSGSRRDEAQIRGVTIEFYRGLAAMDWSHVRDFFTADGRVSFVAAPSGDSTAEARVVPADSALLTWARLAGESTGARGEARVIRSDLRQADGVAAVWVTVHLKLPFQRQPGEVADVDAVEHLVFHRTSDGWRIELLSIPAVPR